VKRREFITLLGGAVAAWPLAARAQQPMPVIGFLGTQSPDGLAGRVMGFHQGLKQSGFVERENVAIEYRWAYNRIDQLPMLAADLVARKVAAIAATGGANAIMAAKGATSTIPIVFTTAGDPVQDGYVASANRPGGNVTGINWFGTLLAAKGMELLRELAPNVTVFALLANPTLPESVRTQQDALEAARTLGRELIILKASSPGEIDAAFATLRQRSVGALLVGGDPFFSARRQQIVALAARDAIPTMYVHRDYVAEGGLISYGNDIPDAYRRAALYVGRILKGEKPGDLPVEQATKFELIINRSTAKKLGVEIPPKLLFTADEVIE
jgi:putative ABC transport system substrate-binding protein